MLTGDPHGTREIGLVQERQKRETIAKIRFWWMRPDVITLPPPAPTKVGVFFILEFKLMSDVTDQYLLRVRFQEENHLHRVLGITTVSRMEG